MNLKRQSELFHAVEWLRMEAIKDNKHAQVALMRLLALERLRRWRARHDSRNRQR